jgi:hypothetical protein
LTGVWRGGVIFGGDCFTGVAFIAGRSVSVVVWNVMDANLGTACSGTMTAV